MSQTLTIKEMRLLNYGYSKVVGSTIIYKDGVEAVRPSVLKLEEKIKNQKSLAFAGKCKPTNR